MVNTALSERFLQQSMLSEDQLEYRRFHRQNKNAHSYCKLIHTSMYIDTGEQTYIANIYSTHIGIISNR